MKYACSSICINPSFPVKQAGFIQQVKPIYNFYDDLHARIIAFDDGEQVAYHVSIDNLGVNIAVQEYLKKYLQSKFDKPVNVTLSATHTHFAGDAGDLRYQGELVEKLIHAFNSLEFKDAKFEIAYKCTPFEGVGTSRITNHKANVLLQLVMIYEDTNPIIGMIVHNCHPTILHGDTPFFSSEYPGYVINELRRIYPNTYFTFMQGAAGDISTRFTRPSQDYSGVIALGNNLVNKVSELVSEMTDLYPFEKIDYDYAFLSLQHEFKPIDISNLSPNLTEREIETIHTGVKVREELSTRLHTLDKQIMISKLSLGPYRFVFCPNEIFSSYIDCVNTENTALVGYSNGYSPYVTGTNDDFLTYEKFTDTLTLETKKNYMKLIEELGRK